MTAARDREELSHRGEEKGQIKRSLVRKTDGQWEKEAGTKIGALWDNAGTFFCSISKMPCSSVHSLCDRCCSKCPTLFHLFLTTHCLMDDDDEVGEDKLPAQGDPARKQKSQTGPQALPDFMAPSPPHQQGPLWVQPQVIRLHLTRYRELSGGCRHGVWSEDGVFFTSPGLCPHLLRPLAFPLAICMGLSSSQLAFTKYPQKCGPMSP